MKMYYKLFRGYYLRRLDCLCHLHIPFAVCPNGMKRREIFYRYDHALYMLYSYGLVDRAYYCSTMLQLTDNVRFSDYSSLLLRPPPAISTMVFCIRYILAFRL